MNDLLLQRYLTNIVADISACEQYVYCVSSKLCMSVNSLGAEIKNGIQYTCVCVCVYVATTIFLN